MELLASPDPRWLFYLARTEDGVHLGRIDVDRQCFDARRSLPAKTRAMTLTPDGKTLYAAGDRILFVIDPATLNVRRQVELNTDIYSLAADNENHVYLGTQGQWTNLSRWDLSGATPSSQQWFAKLHGRIYLKLAPDQNRLYVGTSSVISNHLDALLVRTHRGNAPYQIGIAASDSHGLIRGEFFITPDGQFLLNRWGKVFRLAVSRK
ncbi:MAG TPA: hypothetical protein VN688_27720 [Gemmataceae bacterium]|nr:hypothetical protein [Gemmataceae bacterium]